MKTARSRSLLPALGLFTLLCAAGGAPAADGSARVLTVTGRVSLEQGRVLWAVTLNDQVRPGEIIVSGPDGYALLQIEDGSKFEIYADSRVIFRANRGNWRDVLDIFFGRVKIEIQRFGGRPNPYRVNSATALIAVRGTVFEVAVERNDTTTIAVADGVVAVSHKLLPGGNEVLVKTGEVLVVHPAEPLAQAASISKARIAVRILGVALDRALQTVRIGGGGRRAPVPGGVPGGSAGGSGDLGQAPPPPPDIPDGDSGPGAGPPPSSGGSSGGNAPPPPRPGP